MANAATGARRGRIVLAAAASLGALLVAAPGAPAAVKPGLTLDGPSSDVLSVDGAALADDGTGGIVYRRRVGGVARIFVARFQKGIWSEPRQLETGLEGDVTSPRIAAGERGRLLVVWVQSIPGGGLTRVYSSALDPGTTRFQKPLPIDLSVIGDPASVDPAVVMNAGGSALVAYRSITEPNPANAPAGWVTAQFRLARWRGGTWARRGAINRSTTTPVPPADAGNGPKLAIDQSGNGVIAWQEPDDGLIPRIWARRIFSGTTVGIPLQASPQTLDGRPVNAAADRLSVSTDGIGVAVVAFRQQADPRSSITSPTLMVNTLPDSTSTKAAAFEGAKPVVSGIGSAGPATTVAINADGRYRVGIGDGPLLRTASGDQQTGTVSAQVLSPGSEIAGDPRVVVGEENQAVWAWPLQRGTETGVGVREETADGDDDDAVIAARYGGPVNELVVAGSGFGDALIAFRQGPNLASQVAAAYVDAAPSPFGVTTPVNWVRPAKARIEWDSAPNAMGSLTYSVVLDGQRVTQGLQTRTLRLPVSRLDDGRYRVQVIARDGEGQETISTAVTLKIDASAPQATIRTRRGRRVAVRISDQQPEGSSGIASARIRFGDGKSTTSRTASHRYARPGTYTVSVTAKDRAGNSGATRRRVVVR